MKIKFETVAAVLAVVFVALYMGWMTIPGLNFQAGNVAGPTGSGTLQTVTKPVTFTVIDKYAGSPIQTDILTVYTQDLNQVDSLSTDSSGQDTTNAAWPSGTILYIKSVKSNNQQWFTVTVPKMSAADAQSLTVNGPIVLETYQYTAPTMTVRDSAGNTYADAGKYNYTALGKTPVFTVSWFEGTDGKGFISSYDPIYGISDQALLVLKVNGAEYDEVAITGFDGQIERGSAMYYYKAIDDASVSKWKVGDQYRYSGTGSYSFGASFSSVTGNAVVLDFYVYFNGNWSYFQQKGNFGPNVLSVISGAPYTVALDVT